MLPLYRAKAPRASLPIISQPDTPKQAQSS